MRLLDVGHGARQALRGARRGTVHSVFSRAVYLSLDSRPGPVLVALTGPNAPSGPIHLRSVALGRHRAGQVVLVAADRLVVGATAYDLRAPDWCPDRVPPGALAAARATLLRATSRLPVPDLYLASPSAPGGSRCLPTELVDAVRRGDLVAVRAMVSGRGPGLTPAGDDLLAGILVFAAGLWGEAGWPLISTAADGSATGVIAATFLQWAARGSCIEPVHHLLAAAAREDELGARRAVHRLCGIGASSGADLAFGVRLAARWLPAEPGAGQEVAGEWTQSSLAPRRPGLDQDSGRLAMT